MTGASTGQTMRVYYSLYDRLLSETSLKAAFKKVKSAKGAAGIDGQSVFDFANEEEKHVNQLVAELRTKRYRPAPVRRVTIPKDGGGERKLGIPCVRDRVVQQALLDILQPIFEPHFHPSSYAYRPGRGCHQAVAKVAAFVRQYELEWAVDLDLSKCFDTLNHDLILQAFRKRIADGSVLGLLQLILKSGVMEDGVVSESEVGSPQGGVISPLVANVYLDSFDQEMKKRGHRLVRYADDIVLLKRSKMAAMHVQKQAQEYLEKELRLKVNTEKTKLVHVKEGIPYLGFIIRARLLSIQPKRTRSFRQKVKLLTRRNSGVNLAKVLNNLNPVVRGFANYFKVANCKELFLELTRWIRRRLRAKQMSLWKKPSRLHRRLRQLGYKGEFQSIRMGCWRTSNCPLAHYALPNKELAEMGMFALDSVKTGVLPQPG